MRQTVHEVTCQRGADCPTGPVDGQTEGAAVAAARAAGWLCDTDNGDWCPADRPDRTGPVTAASVGPLVAKRVHGAARQ